MHQTVATCPTDDGRNILSLVVLDRAMQDEDAPTNTTLIVPVASQPGGLRALYRSGVAFWGRSLRGLVPSFVCIRIYFYYSIVEAPPAPPRRPLCLWPLLRIPQIR